MNPYERKLVHDAIAPLDGVASESTGEEPSRRVVTQPACSMARTRSPAREPPRPVPRSTQPRPARPAALGELAIVEEVL